MRNQTGKLSINALKELTGKARATIVSDSTVDESIKDGLFQKVQDKPNIAVVGFTSDGGRCLWRVQQCRCDGATKRLL